MSFSKNIQMDWFWEILKNQSYKNWLENYDSVEDSRLEMTFYTAEVHAFCFGYPSHCSILDDFLLFSNVNKTLNNQPNLSLALKVSRLTSDEGGIDDGKWFVHGDVELSFTINTRNIKFVELDPKSVSLYIQGLFYDICGHDMLDFGGTR